MIEHALGRLPYLTAIWVFAWGLYGIASSRNLVHLVVCLAVLQTASYVFLCGIGYRIGAAAPVFADMPQQHRAVDPVVQALMLTDIVVEATVMALLLAMVVRIHASTRTLDPGRIRLMRG